MDKVLSSCKVRKGSRLHAKPQESEKEERRKQCAKERRTKDERKLRREQDAAKTALRGPARKRNSKVLENITHSTSEIGGDGQTLSMWMLGDRQGEETEVHAVGDHMNAGAWDLGGENAHEDEAEDQGHDERGTGEVEQDDPFADEDDNKENRDPMLIAPVAPIRATEDPARELFLFDESNSGRGVDLLEEVLEF